MKNKLAISYIFTLLSWGSLLAQDLEKIDTQHPVKVTGSVTSGLKYYGASGITSRYKPLIFNTSGFLNVNAYGIDMPISFLFSTQNSEIRQPFNRFGIAPKYKWVKAYIGYSSMTFSPLTFGGNSIMGIGVELTPDKFRFSAVYGRLRKAVSSDFRNTFTIPTYKRMGFGAKLGYGTDTNFIDLILFRAFDDENSIIVADTLNIPAKDNLVIGLNGKYSITPRLSVNLELATSAINEDRNAESADLKTSRWMGKTGLYNSTTSAQVNNAIQAGINYKLEFVDFGITYNRIDPGYQTLSTYFFNNDREELTFNMGLRMMNNKLSLRGGIGQQRNNLANNESTTLSRNAGNVALNYAITPRLNFSFTYSNFSSTVQYLIDEFQADSLNYTQVSESYGANLIYSIRKGSNTHSIALNSNLQGQNVEATTENPGLNNSTLLNLNGRYSINFTRSKMRLITGLNYNSNNFADLGSERYGLQLGGSKSLLNSRVQLNLTISAYNTYQDAVLINVTSNGRFGANYKINKNHSLSLGSSLISREIKDGDPQRTSFKEYRGDVNYRFNF